MKVTRKKYATRQAGRWAMTTAMATLLGVGCAELPEEGEWEDGEQTVEVEGHEQGLIACKAASLSATPNPDPARATVTLTAGKVTGCTPEYLFQYALPGSGTRVDIGTWSSNRTASWTPDPGGPSGAYKVYVQVRPVGGGTANQTGNDVRVGDTCGINAINTSPNPPQIPGTVVGLSVDASCTGGAGVERQYRIRYNNGTSLVTLSNWSTTSSVNWDTAGLSGGNYMLYADVRRTGNLGIDHSLTKSYALGNSCTLDSVTTDPAASADDGTVVVGASASCSGGAAAQYAFDYRPVGTTGWTLLQDWDSDATADWDVSALADGDYQLRARTRAQGFSGTAQSTKSTTFHVGGLCQAVALSTADESPASSVTLQASPSCSSGTPEFLFESAPKGVSPTVWTALGGWTTSPSLEVTSDDVGPGAFRFRVSARAQGSNVVKFAAPIQFTLVELPDVCLSATEIDDPTRSIDNMTYNSENACDQSLVEGWYRFVGSAGTRLPETAPPIFACGTHAPGWLNGAHPTEIGVETSSTVCYHWSGNTCLWNNPISVVNCDGYYVYKLPPVFGCSLRYCVAP